MLSPSTLETERRLPATTWLLASVLLFLAAVFTIGYVVGGEFRSFVFAGAQTAPFTILALLAYVGVERLWGKIVALLWLGGLIIITGLVSVSLTLASFPGFVGIQPGQLPQITSAQMAQVGLVVAGCFGAIVFAALGIIPAVRRALSRVIPLDPQSFVHMVALVAVVALTLIATAPLLVLGAPPVLTAAQNGLALSAGQDDSAQLRTTLYVLVWQIPGALLAVGYGVHRSLNAALQRLGLVRPTIRQVLIGIGAAIALVILANGLDRLINLVWTALSWPRTDSEAFVGLLAFAFNPLGAVVIGITAGLGEELSLRGILQPRLGILLSNLLFTSLHAWQYNWDGLLSVFLIGLALGLVRKRTNTTTSAITHGLYNFTVIMLTVWQGMGAT